ncbi:MAG: excinuclease ABC subunit UvrC [Erysipelotrichaceae bacterium]|nr:excinuclease ABC subunit UvrC [Erysipelotrichaceae bacterium]
MNIKDKLLTLPTKPGCYLMKDKDGKVIYVGKAIVLKNRVNSYFRGAHDYKTTKLVSNIVDFDYIVTSSEKEALILEYNLIKKYDPYFNIVFKDDKSYPYILVRDSVEPRVEVIRLKKTSRKVKGRLFGPYPDVGAARNTVDLINKLYPTRKCDSLGKDICLYYHIKECLGYCKFEADKKECESVKKDIISFLSGDNSAVLRDLKEKMDECTESLNFERSAYYRDLINDIKVSTAKQSVEIRKKESFDVFNYDVLDGCISLTGLFIRNGILLGSDKMTDYLVGDSENMVSSYIYQYYQINPKPKTVYVPKELLPYLEGLEEIEVSTVSKGNKYQLLKKAKENSHETLRQNKDIVVSKNAYYDSVNEELRRIFNKDIKRIELFDNSHTGGTNTVAGMVVYKNLKPSKKDYRLFKLEEGFDDLKSMREAMYRRYFRVLKDDLERPDLIIVDGGHNQIQVAKEVLESLDMAISFCGLVKDDTHNTSFLMDSDFNHIEIDPSSNLFYFLANAQDEVHRFAITYHKKLRKKAVYKSKLDGVEGLGPKLRVKLLKKYKTVSAICQCSEEELATVLPSKVASRLYNKLREEENA